MKVSWVTVSVTVFVLVWVALFVSVFLPSDSSKANSNEGAGASLETESSRKLSSTSEVNEEKAVGEPVRIHLRRQGNDIGDSQDSANEGSQARSSDSVNLPRRYKTGDSNIEPMSLKEVEKNMTLYLHTLHQRLASMAGPEVRAEAVWEAFLDVTTSMPIKWDDQNRHRIPPQRNDKTIFVSLGTYRDPYCPMTIKSLYSQAAHPERLYVALFQQNCFERKCRTGVLVGGRVEDMGSDVDCYKEFCKSPEGQRSGACLDDRVRLFNVNESESLGPYMARYLGAKFYRGENYYLQIDSHSEFVNAWDDKLIKMMEDAPAVKPVISMYPPDSTFNWKDTIGFRMCDSEFAAAQIEWQIVRLGSSMAFDATIPTVPKYAPFVAAGFFFCEGSFIHDVPFDPLLPWIFMGEEISMSARLWTAGYDIFSPTTNVLNHYYVRRHYPKFWESVNRFFKKPIHNDLVEIVLKRVKCMLGYPESRPEMITPQNVLYRLEDWSMGSRRSFKNYMDMVGLDPVTKIVRKNMWCHRGDWPEQALPYKVDDRAERQRLKA